MRDKRATRVGDYFDAPAACGSLSIIIIFIDDTCLAALKSILAPASHINDIFLATPLSSPL